MQTTDDATTHLRASIWSLDSFGEIQSSVKHTIYPRTLTTQVFISMISVVLYLTTKLGEDSVNNERSMILGWISVTVSD